MIILGIDPGLTGAIACLDTDLDAVRVLDTPTHKIKSGPKTRSEIDAYGFSRIIQEIQPDHAFLERVGARPGQGVTSMFRFGQSFGLALGILAALNVPVSLIIPQEWRRLTRTPEGKDGSRQRASQLYPEAAGLFARAKDDGRADAVLIATAGKITIDRA